MSEQNAWGWYYLLRRSLNLTSFLIAFSSYILSCLFLCDELFSILFYCYRCINWFFWVIYWLYTNCIFDLVFRSMKCGFTDIILYFTWFCTKFTVIYRFIWNITVKIGATSSNFWYGKVRYSSRVTWVIFEYSLYVSCEAIVCYF